MWWDGVIVGRSGDHWVPQTPPGMMVEQMGGAVKRGKGKNTFLP